eukprot:3612698-Rhodomonas_salina.2
MWPTCSRSHFPTLSSFTTCARHSTRMRGFDSGTFADLFSSGSWRGIRIRSFDAVGSGWGQVSAASTMMLLMKPSP